MGSAFFTKWSSAEDNGNCQGHYEERKRALCGTENVCHTRLYILIFSWDFRGCQTLPFLRGQTMPRFPKNRGCHRVNSFIFQRANPHILSPYPLHSLFRTLSLFSPIIIIALWNLTGRDFPRHFPLIFTSFPRPFPGYSHTLPTHFH